MYFFWLSTNYFIKLYCMSPPSLTPPVIEELLKLGALIGHCITVQIKYNS